VYIVFTYGCTCADEFRDFFTRYGEVKDHQIMRDHATNRSRGFGFVTFDTEEAVDDLLSMGNKIEFAGTQVRNLLFTVNYCIPLS
jgi:RNA recognition motif-containing protein